MSVSVRKESILSKFEVVAFIYLLFSYENSVLKKHFSDSLKVTSHAGYGIGGRFLSHYAI